jgi:hypothetical protein
VAIGGADPRFAIPILNSAFAGGVFLSFAGLYTAWLYQRRRDERRIPSAH